MNILVIGSGAREHATISKIQSDGNYGKIICCPGNGGIPGSLKKSTLKDVSEIAALAEEKNIDLTIIGPEKYLAEGIANEFLARALKIFGPEKEAAQLETSKFFAKKFMQRNSIPTADFEVIEASLQSDTLNYARNKALSYISETGVVLKADGLAAGKGVYVCVTNEQLDEAISDLFVKRKFGKATDRVVLERRIEGEELSLLTFCDGKTMLPLMPARDYKRRNDNDEGPNTGGMGAYSTEELCDGGLARRIREEIIDRTLEGMQKEKINYRGILYFGLMLTEEGPKVLEYNARFGDPETQVVLPLLKNNLIELMQATIEGKLDSHKLEFYEKSAACVVLASKEYPQKSESGYEIKGINQMPINTRLLHAGTKFGNGKICTNGGRILNVVSAMPSLERAISEAYCGVRTLEYHNPNHFHYRTDIGIDIGK